MQKKPTSKILFWVGLFLYPDESGAAHSSKTDPEAVNALKVYTLFIPGKTKPTQT